MCRHLPLTLPPNKQQPSKLNDAWPTRHHGASHAPERPPVLKDPGDRKDPESHSLRKTQRPHRDLRVPPSRLRPHKAYHLLPEPVETTGSSITTLTTLIVRRTHHSEAPPSCTCGRVCKTLLPHSCQSQHLTLLSETAEPRVDAHGHTRPNTAHSGSSHSPPCAPETQRRCTPPRTTLTSAPNQTRADTHSQRSSAPLPPLPPLVSHTPTHAGTHQRSTH